jgi:hypothetical protein
MMSRCNYSVFTLRFDTYDKEKRSKRLPDKNTGLNLLHRDPALPTSQNILIQMKTKILPGSSTAIVLIHQIDLELLALKWQGSSSVQALSTIIGRKPGAKSGLPVKFD